MPELNPIITYRLSELLAYAAGQKKIHDDAAASRATGPGHELMDGFRESQIRQDELVIAKLEEFQSQGVEFVTTAHQVSDSKPLASVDGMLFMQISKNQVRPVAP